jgi:hypothetical protein
MVHRDTYVKRVHGLGLPAQQPLEFLQVRQSWDQVRPNLDAQASRADQFDLKAAPIGARNTFFVLAMSNYIALRFRQICHTDRDWMPELIEILLGAQSGNQIGRL